jgi:hypothetical protein
MPHLIKGPPKDIGGLSPMLVLEMRSRFSQDAVDQYLQWYRDHQEAISNRCRACVERERAPVVFRSWSTRPGLITTPWSSFGINIGTKLN